MAEQWGACLLGRDGAVLLDIRAHPGAKRSAIQGLYGNRLKVAVHAPPVDGKANAALLAFIADWLSIPRRHVQLAAGSGNRDKTLQIDALVADVLKALGATVPPEAGA